MSKSATQSIYDDTMTWEERLRQKRRGSCEQQLVDVKKQLAEVKNWCNELVDVIGYVEWTNAVDGGLVCPWCGNRRYEGHEEYCPRQVALASAKGASQ